MPTLVVDQVLSGASLGLSFGLADLLVVDFGGQRVLYGLSRTENKLVRIDIATNGDLSFNSDRVLNGTFEAGSNPALEYFADAGGGSLLAIAGLPLTSGQAVTLTSGGALGSQSPLSPAGTLVAPVAFNLGAEQALVTGITGGLELLVDSGGGYGPVATLSDTSTRYLADISDGVGFTISGTYYIATLSSTENGVNLAQVSPTSLAQVDALGAAEGLPIAAPTEIDAIQRLGETTLIVGSAGTSSLSTVSVDATGALLISDHILDSPDTYVQGVSAINAVTHGDFAFFAAAGADGGVSLFTVLPCGRIVHIDSIADDATTTLYRVSAIELTVTGARLDLLVSSAWEAGVTRISYDLSTLGSVLLASTTGGTMTGSAADDQIIGSSLNDTLIGGAGQDTIADGAGQDELHGGGGADLFVMHADGQSDTITDFDRTQDRMDLSAFDFLYDVSQLSVTPTAGGAILTHGTETIVIYTSDNAPLTAAELTNDMILNVDRPPHLPVAQELIGSGAADTLNGAAGNDTVIGAGGDDVLTGQFGDDTITGGAGNDTLDGGSGDDTLSGQSGDDTLVGGAGDDVLTGGADDDVLYGDEYDWMGA